MEIEKKLRSGWKEKIGNKKYEEDYDAKVSEVEKLKGHSRRIYVI